MYKTLLILVFIAVIISLWSAFFFLMRDSGDKRRTVKLLMLRVGLSLLLIALVAYGLYSGQLGWHGFGAGV